MWWKVKLWYLKHMLGNDEGIGVVEMILILVVLIGLVIIFRDQLKSLVDSIFSTISSDAASV